MKLSNSISTARKACPIACWSTLKPKKAKVWRADREYQKVGDFHGETHCFELSKCAFDVDFSRLWKRKGGQAKRRPGCT